MLDFNKDLKSDLYTDKEIAEKISKTPIFCLPEYKDIKLKYSANCDSKVANIKNWLRYKILAMSKGITKDCDCLSVVHSMYNTVFGIENTNKEGRYFKIAEHGIILETDTMNSFGTLFFEFMRVYLYKAANNGEKPNYKINGKSSELKRNIEYLLNIDEWYKKINNEEIKKVVDLFEKFAGLTHCPANMIIVPRGYNTGRASKTKDFWNLSLIDLQGIYYKKEYYDDSYSWFCENIEQFKLDDWFEKENQVNFINWKVKPLFKGQSFEKIMPHEISEFEECVSNIIERINNRAESLKTYKTEH